MNDLESLETDSLKGPLEALLLVSSDPVSASQLASVLDATPGEVASLLAELKVEYEEANRGFQLREVAGGWRLFTHPAYHEQVEAFVLSIIYGTTNAFLEKFGLRSTRDLPDLEQFAPDEQARQFIRERLSGRTIQSTLDEVNEDLEEERELIEGSDPDEGHVIGGDASDGELDA